MLKKSLFIAVLMASLTSCINSSHYEAPVSDIHTIEHLPTKGQHQVQKGETLYEIAWRYGLDYRDLIKRNHLHGSQIAIGQILYLKDKTVHPRQQVKKIPGRDPFHGEMSQLTVKLTSPKHSPANINKKWHWPTLSQHIINYPSPLENGINIAGHIGDPIYASASGKVVYAGNGLRGYGNLIIIKHGGQYLSAYAHLQNMRVKEGKVVKQGEKIAEMAQRETGRTMLHFEIRLAGKPVNPLTLFH